MAWHFPAGHAFDPRSSVGTERQVADESTFSFAEPATWSGFTVPVLGAIAVVLMVGFFIGRRPAARITTGLPRTGGSAVTIAPLIGQAVALSESSSSLSSRPSVFWAYRRASILAVVGAASLALALALAEHAVQHRRRGSCWPGSGPVAVGEYITGDGVEEWS